MTLMAIVNTIMTILNTIMIDDRDDDDDNDLIAATITRSKGVECVSELPYRELQGTCAA